MPNRRSQFRSNSERVLGSHEKGIKAVLYHDEIQSVITGSWDKAVNFWDHRADRALVASYMQGGKVYSMTICAPHRLVVATSERHVYIYDVRQMAKPEQHRESSLLHQTRCVRGFPDGTGRAFIPDVR